MTRFLTIVNLLGVLALAGLCAAQWRFNSRLSLQAQELDETRQAQAARIAEQEKTIKGNTSEIDDLHQRLSQAQAAQKETEGKLGAMTSERDRLTTERTQLAAGRDQIKATLEKWMAAVAERDKTLKDLQQQLQAAANERNEAVTKFNDLVTKYNAAVKELNAKNAAGH